MSSSLSPWDSNPTSFRESQATTASYVTADTMRSASSVNSAPHGTGDIIDNQLATIPESPGPTLQIASEDESTMSSLRYSNHPASQLQDETSSPGEVYELRTRPSGKGFSVLSLDGGGCRGYISLLTLKYLLRQLQPKGLIYPYLYFDLICGTSTGGLITILLAVLHLDIDTALELYYRLVGQVFANGFSILRYLLKDAGYSRKPLERAIREILRDRGGGRRLMIDPTSDRGCCCFVTTAHCLREQRNVLTVRSYQTPGDPPTIPRGYEWTCFDAALATAAAPMVFGQHYIDRFRFEDAGAHRENNPTKVAWGECRKLGGINKSLFISLGTGTRRAFSDPEQAGCFGLFQQKIETFKASIKHGRDVNAVHEWMQEEAGRSEMSYFRLNPPLGRKIGLGDWEELPAMEDCVERFCRQNETELNECAAQLRLFQTVKRG